MKSMLAVPAAVLAASLGFLAAGCGSGESPEPAGHVIELPGSDASPREAAQPLPPILVSVPSSGQEVSSPVVIRGTADVFEGNVTVKVLDESGVEIAGTFTARSSSRRTT